jgi:SAM-dependent methyltransferase
VPRRYRYLLGDARREAVRLRAQARLWDPVSLALFDRLKIRRGWKILEIGPGQGSLHLELRRRAQAAVDAVERSPVFAARLRRRIRRDGFGAGRLWESDLVATSLPRETYDLIFARWVFLFLPNPEALVRKLARSLKPGGFLAIEDYHRDSLALVPRPPEWYDFILADRAFFASQGGDASIGSRLPDLYRRAGLQMVDIEVTIKSGRPGTPVWDWLTTYFMGVMDRYARFPPLTAEKAKRLRQYWSRASTQPTSRLVGPALLDLVGRKPR